MKVIKQVGPKHDDQGQAQDALAGISVIPGFVFGFVDASNRCVSFHQAAPGELQRGQQEVELVFAPTRQVGSEALAKNIKPVADLIFGVNKTN